MSPNLLVLIFAVELFIYIVNSVGAGAINSLVRVTNFAHGMELPLARDDANPALLDMGPPESPSDRDVEASSREPKAPERIPQSATRVECNQQPGPVCEVGEAEEAA